MVGPEGEYNAMKVIAYLVDHSVRCLVIIRMFWEQIGKLIVGPDWFLIERESTCLLGRRLASHLATFIFTYYTFCSVIKYADKRLLVVVICELFAFVIVVRLTTSV